MTAPIAYTGGRRYLDRARRVVRAEILGEQIDEQDLDQAIEILGERGVRRILQTVEAEKLRTIAAREFGQDAVPPGVTAAEALGIAAPAPQVPPAGPSAAEALGIGVPAPNLKKKRQRPAAAALEWSRSNASDGPR